MRAGWQFWIDRGGTFTDIVGRDPTGRSSPTSCSAKIPAAIATPPSPASRRCSAFRSTDRIPAGLIEAVKMGTTVATNALLERKGDRTLLVVNRGFADALRIGNQARPRLFDLAITLPTMLYETGGGDRRPRRASTAPKSNRSTKPPRADALPRRAADGITACAIVLMHAWKYPAHEQRLAELAREAGFTQVSASHAVSPLLRLVPRGDTTVVDAYLSPILRRYVDQVCRRTWQGTSSISCSRTAAWPRRARFQGKDAILSGPAGGIVGAARTAAMAGLDRIIGFDMGGTSTDVALYAGELRTRVRNRGRRRAHARADDGDQYRRGGRRLDPAFRRRPVARRAGFRRRRSRAGLLPPRRPADGDRRQCLRGQNPAGAFSRDLRPERRQPLDADVVAEKIRRAGRRDRARHRRRRDRRSRSPRASCGSPSPTWPTRSSRSRCRRATTSAASPCNVSAAPAASTPAWWPMRWAWKRCSSIRSPACCRPTAWASPTRPRCASRRWKCR